MADKITPRNEDFSKWYQDVVIQARLADYSPVKGCMVIRPNGYSIWEKIQSDLDRRFKDVGARNAYFPLLIPESFLKKEAEHVEGFAPQCAVVTYAGAKELEEKLIIRPTSETVVNAMFSKWIQSYRDLPMVLNQWVNVVRWEMRTRLFIRTTEFLWQEGHTCHATAEEAENLTRKMLRIYSDFAQEQLAIPVIAGLKTESERFAGALKTYCIEAMMQDRKALQAGTSHNLSTHFAKAFDTQYLDKSGRRQFVHQTSWGVSTRLVGGVIMTHSDDKGLVLPPRLASTHVIVMPIFGKNQDLKSKIYEAADHLANAIRDTPDSEKLPYKLGIDVDRDETKQPGWKFHEYELIGIPIRIELGPRDLEKGQAVLTRRDLGKKEFVPLEKVPGVVVKMLDEMQSDLLEKARKLRDENTFPITSFSEFTKKIEDPGGFFTGAWCKNPDCETKLKQDARATIRCIMLKDLDESFETVTVKKPCMICGKTGENVQVVFARSY